jgi:hypothetical protein
MDSINNSITNNTVDFVIENKEKTQIKGELKVDDIEFEQKIEDDFVWEELPTPWKTKLLSDRFVIKNCLGDGNCQFRSIETALTNAGCKTDHERLRRSLCKYINSLDMKDFFEIVQNYRIEKQNGEFVGDWDPFSIKNKRDFNAQLKRPGFNFQGDNTTLALISKALNVDIILLTDDLDITDLSNPDKLEPKLIVLYYDKKSQHYQTVGLLLRRRRIPITMFKRSELPEEIDRLIDRHNFFIYHIRDICTKQMSCGKLQLNKIIKDLEERVQTRMSSDDKKTIIQIIRMILDNENFFNKLK